jgi:hypothetical protein
MIPIYVTLLLKVISHGDDVHKLQQPVPSGLGHSTVWSLRLVIGLSSIDDVDDDDDGDGDNWLILAASSDVLDDDVVNDDVVCI